MLSVKTVKTQGAPCETIHECDFIVKEPKKVEGKPHVLIRLCKYDKEGDVQVLVANSQVGNVCQHVFVMNELGKTIEAFHAE